jgi:hypothetical protein
MKTKVAAKTEAETFAEARRKRELKEEQRKRRIGKPNPDCPSSDEIIVETEARGIRYCEAASRIAESNDFALGKTKTVQADDKESSRSRPDKLNQITLRLKPGGKYKEAVLRAIRTLRQKLAREAKRGCSVERRKEIDNELKDLLRLEHQQCDTGPRKHPTCTRLSARDLGFATEAPSADEIFERAMIWRGLVSKKPHLMFAKLSEKDPARWGEVAKREAEYNPKIKRTRERIEFGDIAEIKWSDADRVIAQNYFQSKTLKLPLRQLSAEKAVEKLVLKLGIYMSPYAFDRALRRLFLVD